MQIAYAHHLSKLWKKNKKGFLWNTVCIMNINGLASDVIR